MVRIFANIEGRVCTMVALQDRDYVTIINTLRESADQQIMASDAIELNRLAALLTQGASVH